MCCASAPGYLAALIHHAVNSAAPSARAIFRTLAPSRRGCLRTARHLGSFSCRSSITFENLFVNGAYAHRTNFWITYATYHFFAMRCLRDRIKRRGGGNAGNVTLLAEKPLWHNGFLPLEKEVIQRHYSFENAFNSVTEETFIFVLQGDVEV